MDEQSRNYLPTKLENEFDEFYRATLLQDFRFLEPQRKKYLKQFFIMLALFGFGFFVVGVLVRKGPEYVGQDTILPNVVAILFVGLCLFAAFMLPKPAKKYKRDTKKMVMPKIMAFFKHLTYKWENGGISANVIRESDLFEGMEKVYYDDTFQGSHKGTKFQLGEQRVTTYVQTKNGRREVTMFKGIFLLFELGKKFNGQTVVNDKKGQGLTYFLSFLGGALFLWLVVMNIKAFFADGFVNWNFLIWAIVVVETFLYGFFKNKYKKVYLEDVVFAKNWKVKATDQVEARYVLTPALMERMLKIKKMFYGNSIHFAFFNNKVLIAVGTNKDMFETTSLFASAFEYRRVREVIVQFYNIFAVIDEMKQKELDANIGQLKKSNRVVENM